MGSELTLTFRTQPHEPKPINTEAWNPKGRDVNIEKFVATAVLMKEFDDKGRQLVHWRGGGAYGRVSTSFDTCKHDDEPEVEVEFISLAYAVSIHAPYHWESGLARAYTANDVYKLLEAKKFNHFLYNGAGSGCLTWTTALVDLLENEGVLPEGSKKSFLGVVKQAREDDRLWVPEEPGAKFY